MNDARQPQGARTGGRITNLLLVLTAVFFTSTVLLGGYLFTELRSLQQVKAEHLARAELEQQALAQSDSDRALFPPAHGEIGFLLNPFMDGKRASFLTPGKTYPVNSLGLRGKEIKLKAPGVKRILLLGDSMFFGWKVEDGDRLEAVLGELLDEKLGAHPYEVVTVALPGWNLEAEAQVLETYFSILDPDIVVWGVMDNDVNFSPGLGANDVFTTYYTRQGGGAVVRRNFSWPVADIVMPAVRERWHRALGAVKRMVERHELTAVLYNFNVNKNSLAVFAGEVGLDLPVIHRPPAVTDDTALWVEARDKHPSREGNRVWAVSILHRLSESGILPEISFTAGERAVIETYAAYQAVDTSPASLARDMAEAAERIPIGYRPGDERWWGHLYGAATGEWRLLLQDGVIYLRLPPENNKIRGIFGMAKHLKPYERNLELILRGQNGEEITTVLPIEGEKLDFTLDVTALRGLQDIVEITWHFDFAECIEPHVCPSAALVALGTVP
jgi:hypothetical protein